MEIWAPDLTLVDNPYPSYSGRVTGQVWPGFGSGDGNIILYKLIYTKLIFFIEKKVLIASGHVKRTRSRSTHRIEGEGSPPPHCVASKRKDGWALSVVSRKWVG